MEINLIVDKRDVAVYGILAHVSKPERDRIMALNNRARAHEIANIQKKVKEAEKAAKRAETNRKRF